jgi:hypothetical protein
MKFYFFLIFFFCLQFSSVQSSFASFHQSENVIISSNNVGEKSVKPIKKNKNKPSKKDTKPFPVFAFIATMLGVLALGTFALGIYLKLLLFIGIIGATLAIAALTMGILGLKKGENKTLCYVGILLGAVALIGAIFYLISVASAP